MTPSLALRSSGSPFLWLNLALFLLTFLRLLNADDGISYDYRHYINFLDEISRTGIENFLTSATELFADNYWADFKEFEAGFILLAYPFARLLDPVTAYAVIASVSLLVKLEVLRFFKVDLYKVVIFFLFDISLFECNAIRAGIALSVVMAGCALAVRNASFLYLLAGALLASFFHTSALALFLSALVAQVFCRMNVQRIGVVLMAVFGYAVTTRLDIILEGAGGKLAYYLVLARDYDRYTGASGLNSASVLCAVFAAFFAAQALRGGPRPAGRRDSGEYFYFAMTLAITTGILILFSGIIAVIGDRIWQLVLPLLIVYLSYYRQLSAARGRPRLFFDPGSRADAYFFVNVAVNILLFYYVVVGILIRFPLTNFFSWLSGATELIPLEAF